MVSMAGGYFRGPFKGQIGVTQEDPLSPTIFNVVVGSVLPNWVSEVELT